jgi:hypothetical protein
MTYRPIRPHIDQSESILWNRLLGFLNVYKYGLRMFILKLLISTKSCKASSYKEMEVQLEVLKTRPGDLEDHLRPLIAKEAMRV